MADPVSKFLTPVTAENAPAVPPKEYRLSSGKGAADNSLMDIAGEASNVVNKALAQVVGTPGDLEMLAQVGLNWLTDGGYKIESNIFPTSDKVKTLMREWEIIDQDYQLPETASGAKAMEFAETVTSAAGLGGLGAAKSGLSVARGALSGAGAGAGAQLGTDVAQRTLGEDNLAGAVIGGLGGALVGGAGGAKLYDAARRLGAVPGGITPTAQRMQQAYGIKPSEGMVSTSHPAASGASQFENSMSYLPGSAQKMRDRASIIVQKMEDGMNKAFTESTARISNREMGQTIHNLERASQHSIKKLGNDLYSPLTKQFAGTTIQPRRLVESILGEGKTEGVKKQIQSLISKYASNSATAGMDFDTAKRLKGVLATQATKMAKRGDQLSRFYAEASKAIADDIDDAAKAVSPELYKQVQAANGKFREALQKETATWRTFYKEGMAPETAAARLVSGLDKGGTQFERVLTRAQELDPRSAKQMVDYAIQRAGIDSNGQFSFSQWMDKMKVWEEQKVFDVLKKHNPETTNLIQMFRSTAKEAVDIQSIAAGQRIPTQYNIIKLLVDTTAGNTMYKLIYNKPVMSLLSRAAAKKMSWSQVISGLAVIQATNPQVKEDVQELMNSVKTFAKQGPRY